MSVLYVPRSAWFAGTPTSNSGSPRPLLRQPVSIITRHYTGSPPSSKAATWAARDYMPWFQSVVLASGKSYEYNFIVPPRVDGSSQVWEYAGDYQAAHSSGENDIAVGVLFAIGVANHPSYSNYDPNRPTVWEPLTDEMVDAYRWLRDVHLKGRGVVATNVAQIEHRFMPGAATACPGSSVMARAADLLAPYAPAPPIPPKDDDMPNILWRPRGYKNVFITNGVESQAASSAMIAAQGLDPGRVTVDDHKPTLKSVLAHAGLDLDDLTLEPSET